MKTINDLQQELSSLYGNLISNITPTDLNIMTAFLLTTFADDFAVVKSNVYKYNSPALISNNNRIYLDDIDQDFLEIKYLLPIKPSMSVLYSIMQQNEMLNGFLSLEETFTIQMTSQYVSSMTSYYVPKKPPIFTDSTGSYVSINKDSVLVCLCERIVNPANIPEYVYTVLRAYANYKFIDFILNRSFGNTLEMNNKIFNLMYDSIESDVTSGGGNEGISSVSLGGLSVSFDNKLQSYATTLASLANQANNPTFVNEMDKMRTKYHNQFKRKKNIFYNYMF